MPEAPQTPSPVAEVTHAAEHHGHLVAHGAAGLDDAGGARGRPPRPGRRGTGRRRRSPPPCPSDRPAWPALMLAMRAESRRLIWPAPTPMVMPFLQKTMALLLTYLATFQANSRSFSSWRGLLGGHHLQVGQRQLVVVGRLQQHAAADALHVHGVAALVPVGPAALGQVASSACARSCSRRWPALRGEAGAISTSTNCLTTAPMPALRPASVERDDAAESAGGSVWKALL